MQTSAPWHDPTWVEKSDTAWQRRLRRHQGWWREVHLDQVAGTIPGGDRLVVSMLPTGVGLSPNLLTPEAERAAQRALEQLSGSSAPGLVQIDRLQRNLLSSQPLCFNLFGHLQTDPGRLLPWVRSIAPGAAQVNAIDLETAPTTNPLGGSAFDAFVTYDLAVGGTGFLGIECKYAEDLKQAQRGAAAQKYLDATTGPDWALGAAGRLDRPGLRQFWYNTLLAQRVLQGGGHVEGRSVVVALRDDRPARQAADEVAAALSDPAFLTFSALEEVVDAVDGDDDWKRSFRARYLELGASA